jgi:phage shock protein PspC (stress-responsive transcriptional regulator)
MNKKLRRSRTDRRIAGVCGGLAQFLDIDSTAVRVAMALLILFGGMSLIVYLVMWLIIPDEY